MMHESNLSHLLQNFGAAGVEEIVSRLLGLRAAFVGASSNPTTGSTVCRSICQLLAGFAEQNMTTLLPHLDSDLVQQYVDFLNACTLQLPNDMVDVTLPFWRALQKQVMAEGSTAPRSASVLRIFERLLSVLLQRASFPDNWEEETEMDQDQFFDFRSRLDQTLRSVFDVLGETRYLSVLHAALEHPYSRVLNTPALLASASEWVPLEAVFFGVSAVAPSIPTSSPLLAQFAQAAFMITSEAAKSGSTDRINENLIVSLIKMFGTGAQISFVQTRWSD